MKKQIQKFFLLRHRWMTHLIFLLVRFIFPILAAFIVTEIQMAIHLFQTGQTRVEQSKNYGLAFEAFLLAVVTFILTPPVMPGVWWFAMRERG